MPDPMTIVMFALIGLLIFFMFRNGRKRQAQMQELQSKMVPGAEVMLQSGIFGTIVSMDDEDNRATISTGTSTLVVHRNAIGQVVTPADVPEMEEESVSLAPDDDPAFGERLTSNETPAAENNVDDIAPTTDETEKGSDKE